MMKGTSLRSFHGLGCPNSKDFRATMVFVNMISSLANLCYNQAKRYYVTFVFFLVRGAVYFYVFKIFFFLMFLDYLIFKKLKNINLIYF
jgi:hypothetical protein